MSNDKDKNLRSASTSHKQFEELDEKGKPATIVKSITERAKEFIVKIDSQIVEKFKIEKSQKPADQIAIYKKQIEQYRQLFYTEYIAFGQENSDKLNTITSQESKIQKLEQTVDKLNVTLSKTAQASDFEEDVDLGAEYTNVNRILQEIDEALSLDPTSETAEVGRIKNLLEILNKSRNFIKYQKTQFSEDLIRRLSQIKELEEQINLQETENMNVEAKDAIMAIPVFSGDMKEFDAFMNTCDLYDQLVQDKPNLLIIIKAKIRGEALSKVSPMDDCTTWALLKGRLRERIKKPVSLEFAQEDLNTVFQRGDESVESYGKKVKEKLRKLNEASMSLAESNAEKSVLRKANEKLAISKFEQNIRNSTIRVLVSASAKTSLDDAIQTAMQKELIEKNKNIKTCSYCNMDNHTFENCRRRQASNQASSSNKNRFPKPGYSSGYRESNQSNSNNPNNSSNSGYRDLNFNKSNYKDSNANKTFNKNETKQESSSSNSADQNKNRNFGKYPSYKNFNNKNVRMVEHDEDMDMTTLQDVLDEESSYDSSKNE